MRKFFKVVFIATIFSMAFSSCNKDDENSNVTTIADYQKIENLSVDCSTFFIDNIRYENVKVIIYKYNDSYNFGVIDDCHCFYYDSYRNVSKIVSHGGEVYDKESMWIDFWQSDTNQTHKLWLYKDGDKWSGMFTEND